MACGRARHRPWLGHWRDRRSRRRKKLGEPGPSELTLDQGILQRSVRPASRRLHGRERSIRGSCRHRKTYRVGRPRQSPPPPQSFANIIQEITNTARRVSGLKEANRITVFWMGVADDHLGEVSRKVRLCDRSSEHILARAARLEDRRNVHCCSFLFSGRPFASTRKRLGFGPLHCV